ncbi:MAG: hypothetical protein WC641_05505 [Patescibacteria group bacterium]
MSNNPFEIPQRKIVPEPAAPRSTWSKGLPYTSGIRRQDLPTSVRKYADKLATQIKDIYSKYGAKNFEELKENKKLSAQDARKVADLLKAFQNAVEKKEVEPGLREAVEILGRENVHGIEDVEAMLGKDFIDISKVPPIPYTSEDLAKSKEIKEKTGVEEMLVLFVADKDGKPLTGERMNGLIQAEYTKLGLGKFLADTDRNKNESFFTQLGLNYEWKLISKQTIPDSENKYHSHEPEDTFDHRDTQEFVIEEYAEKLDIPRDQFHRSEPFQMLYATALHLIATENLNGKGKGERILANNFHWSDVRSSDRNFVCIGLADSPGADVLGCSRNDRGFFIGVCLSRESSSSKS